MKPAPHTSSVSRAIVLTEAIVSIMLVGMVLGVVSLLLARYARATDYFLNHRRAQLAAESCVERMRAGTLAVTDATFTDDARVNCEIRVTAADETWAPLRHVQITTTVTGRHGKTTRYALATYVAGNGRHDRALPPGSAGLLSSFPPYQGGIQEGLHDGEKHTHRADPDPVTGPETPPGGEE